MVCLAAERFVSLRFPLHVNSRLTKTNAISVLICIIIVSLVFNLLHAFEYQLEAFPLATNFNETNTNSFSRLADDGSGKVDGGKE